VNRDERRAQQAAINKAAGSLPAALTAVPREQWPPPLPGSRQRLPFAVWRSRFFLVQAYDVPAGGASCRLSIRRVNAGDRITWDELQQIKRDVGYGDACAVEMFPPDRDVVNVANMRHLWIVTQPPFMWSKP
jgi:hypothetical protein